MDNLKKVHKVSGATDKAAEKEEPALEVVDRGKIDDLLMMNFLVILHLVSFLINFKRLG